MAQCFFFVMGLDFWKVIQTPLFLTDFWSYELWFPESLEETGKDHLFR